MHASDMWLWVLGLCVLYFLYLAGGGVYLMWLQWAVARWYRQRENYQLRFAVTGLAGSTLDEMGRAIEKPWYVRRHERRQALRGSIE